MVLAIGVGAPMPGPVGVDQHGLATQVETGEPVGVDRLNVGNPDDEARHAGDTFQTDVAQILAVGVAMEGRVQVCVG